MSGTEENHRQTRYALRAMRATRATCARRATRAAGMHLQMHLHLHAPLAVGRGVEPNRQGVPHP